MVRSANAVRRTYGPKSRSVVSASERASTNYKTANNVTSSIDNYGSNAVKSGNSTFISLTRQMSKHSNSRHTSADLNARGMFYHTGDKPYDSVRNSNYNSEGYAMADG